MKKIIFTSLLCVLGLITSVEAQLKFSNANKKSTSTTNKRMTKDPHWKFSTYEPATSKKDQRKNNKATKQLAAKSYSPEKSAYYDKKQERELKAKKIRQKRVKGEKIQKSEKQSKSVRKDADKKNAQRQKMRAQKVNSNKKNYGTRASRKSSQSISILAPKPKMYKFN
jgi:hypothetical protein